MLKPGPAKKLTITVNESDRWYGKAVYDALLELFQHKGLAGATVSRAIAGFSGRGAIRTIHLVDVSAPLPVRIEVVDTAAAIDRVLPDVYDMVERGLVEVQDTQVVKAAAQDAGAPRTKETLMRHVTKGKMVAIHVSENHQWEGEPLYQAIVKRARVLDIAGATVYRGILGYGAHRRLHAHKTLSRSHEDPVMVEVLDSADKVDQLLAALETMLTHGCAIAISDVTIVRYEHAAPPEQEGPAEQAP